MNIKSSICGIQHTCINFLIFLIGLITKIECWPVIKQDPRIIYTCSHLDRFFFFFLVCLSVIEIIFVSGARIRVAKREFQWHGQLRFWHPGAHRLGHQIRPGSGHLRPRLLRSPAETR